jgi:hypothetical protein
MSRIRCTRTCLALWIVFGGSRALPAQTNPPGPVIQLTETTVTASGVTEGAAVAWFSVARVIEDLAVRVVARSEVVTDADGDGVVQLALEGPLPLKSVWVAVDLQSGGYTAAAPEGSPLEQGDFLQKGTNGDLLIARSLIHLFRARTGEEGTGAWAVRAGDGGPRDEDGAGDGLLHVGLGQLTNARGSAAPVPGTVSGADVLVVIDPSRLDYQIVRGDS